MTVRPVSGNALLLLALGFCVWASALVILYALHSIGCSFAWTTAALRLGLGAVLLLHLALIGIAWRRNLGDRVSGETAAFLHQLTLWTLISAFATIILTLGPVLLLTPCT